MGIKKLSSCVIAGSALYSLLSLSPVFAQTTTEMADRAKAEKPEPTVEERFNNAEKKPYKPHLFSLTLENDLFGSGTDENYTNGFRVSYMNLETELHPLILKGVDLLPFFERGEKTVSYYSFGQNLYTPSNLKTPTPDPNDRPYAAWLYGSAGLTTAYENHVDDLEIALGVVGPAALGEPVQKAVHKYIAGDTPEGWDTQLDNEPGLIITYQRTWPSFFDYSLLGFTLGAAPHAGMALGNIYTYANTGVTLSLAPSWQNLQANPLRVRPAVPGSGYYEIPAKKWGWYVFAGFDGRAIARNIFLDGNSFADSRSVDKKYFVGDISGGFALTYEDYRFSYTLNYRTEEFHTQDDAQLFGSVSISKRF